ncbi:sugar phosphate isomerase/epimerase family protein [Tundrisphaera lichenicola]|uniref:sugar phosphate isomerase/epimerase family protein n=1 Tax=Tundrisphaera lichenicola TaxID=2029860 RepID=UPI003EB8B090
MIAYGFPKLEVAIDLEIARRIGASLVEVLPDWKSQPDPVLVRRRAEEFGLSVHSVHGCWGGRTIRANRVDLGNPDPSTHRASVHDLKLCIDWILLAGGTFLVVHPGGYSAPEDAVERADSLALGLIALADHARGTGVTLCVENMPPGVHPGSRMKDLAALVDQVGRAEVALALDTGHAHISADPATETIAAGKRLGTTHVHDNDGALDAHLPPGLGSLDWGEWVKALDAIDYRGPIVLECIRHLRQFPENIDESFLVRLQRLIGVERSGGD